MCTINMVHKICLHFFIIPAACSCWPSRDINLITGQSSHVFTPTASSLRTAQPDYPNLSLPWWSCQPENSTVASLNVSNTGLKQFHDCSLFLYINTIFVIYCASNCMRFNWVLMHNKWRLLYMYNERYSSLQTTITKHTPARVPTFSCSDHRHDHQASF